MDRKRTRAITRSAQFLALGSNQAAVISPQKLSVLQMMATAPTVESSADVSASHDPMLVSSYRDGEMANYPRLVTCRAHHKYTIIHFKKSALHF